MSNIRTIANNYYASYIGMINSYEYIEVSLSQLRSICKYLHDKQYVDDIRNKVVAEEQRRQLKDKVSEALAAYHNGSSTKGTTIAKIFLLKLKFTSASDQKWCRDIIKQLEDNGEQLCIN